MSLYNYILVFFVISNSAWSGGFKTELQIFAFVGIKYLLRYYDFKVFVGKKILKFSKNYRFDYNRSTSNHKIPNHQNTRLRKDIYGPFLRREFFSAG